MNIVVPVGELRDASIPVYRQKSILIDRDADGSATSSAEACKRVYYACPGPVSLVEHSYKLTTLAVESLGRLDKGGSELINQLATNVVGGADSVNPRAGREW